MPESLIAVLVSLSLAEYAGPLHQATAHKMVPPGFIIWNAAQVTQNNLLERFKDD